MTRARLVRLTVAGLLVWVLSSIPIYWLFVSFLSIPSTTAVVVIGLAVLLTAPVIAIATARNFRRIGDKGIVAIDKRSVTIGVLFLVFGFGVAAIFVLTAIAALEHENYLGSAVFAIGAALLASILTLRLRALQRMGKGD